MKKKIVSYGLSMIVLISVFAMAMPATAVLQMADEFGVSNASGDTGTYVEVPVTIMNATNGPIQAMQFKVQYDTGVLDLSSVEFGDLTATGWSKTVGLNIVLDTDVGNALPDSSTGSVVILNFSVIGAPDTETDMNITDILFSNIDFQAGIAPAKNGMFYVTGEDTTPPTITAVLPEDGATDVPVSTTISATFSEAMNKTSTEAAYSLTPTVSGAFTWDGNTMTFTPDAYLAFSTEYTVTIAATATDLAGNGLDGNENGTAEGSPTDDYNWSFTTGIDTTPPKIFNLQPADGSFINDTKPTISANYSDLGSGINESSVEIVVDGTDVTLDPNTTVTATGVSYTPATDLSEGLHNVIVNVSDNAVSPNTNSTSWSFTVDVTEPTIEFVVPPTPVNNTEVPVNYVNVTVNVTDNFDLTQAVGILWWNETETESMTKIMYALNNKSQFYFNKTNLANGDYTYKVYANDTAGNMNVSETRVVTVNKTGTILDYYRSLGEDPNKVETTDLLKAADDWREDVIPPGFTEPLTTTQLLQLADEWRMA
jgi:hypothetical protein